MTALAQSIVAVFVGVISAYVTGFLVPRRQHRFWIRQQRFDLCAANIKELHSLSAKLFEYLGPDWATGELTGAHSRERDTKFEDEFARDWRATIDQSAYLFSEDARQKLGELTAKLHRVLFRTLPEEPERAYDIWDEFVRARQQAFEALYADLLADPPSRASRAAHRLIQSIGGRRSPES
jgi:hypothetical protein